MKIHLGIAVTVLVVAVLSGCIGLDGPVQYKADQGFEHRDSSVGSEGFLSHIRNVGPPAESAEFMVTLRDGTEVVWTGRASVEDIDAGEDLRGVRYEGDRPLPNGAYAIEWRVVDVQR